MKRVLIVAYYYPPLAGIGSIRLARFAHYLPEFGWEPVVLAPSGTPHADDPELSYDPDRVVRAKSFELSQIGRGSRAHGGPTGPARLSSRSREGATHRVRERAKRMVFPDAQIGWLPGAVAAGRRLLEREHFDAVFSSSFPITAHLVADALRRRGNLRWVAEFRDPWSDRLASGPRRRAARALERRIAHRADRVAMPTPTWAAHFGAAWGSEVAVLGNGHELAPATEPPAAPPMLTHVGSHYPDHYCDLGALWQALAKLGRAGTTVPRLRWVGSPPEGLERELWSAGLSETDITGPVSHPAAVRFTCEAAMLFASGPRDRNPIARGWMPAKLFEYLASGRPVLLVGDPHGDAAALLRGQAGCFVREPGDVDGILDALRTGLESPTYPREAERFSRRSRTSDLAGLLAGSLDAVSMANRARVG